MNEFKGGGGGGSCNAVRIMFYIPRNRNVSRIPKQLVVVTLQINLAYVGFRT
jgi:hypothetical protein